MTDMLTLDQAIGLEREEDRNSYVFTSEPVKNERKTRKAGRSIYEVREFVEVLMPGITRDQPKFRVSQDWLAGATEKAKRAHREFKEKGEERHVEGTPLEFWPMLDKGLAAELNSINVFTVEQLVALSDEGLQEFGPGGRRLQERAKLWLDLAEGGKMVGALENTNEQQKGRITTLESTVAALEAQVQDLKQDLAQAPKRGPGRPPGSKNKDAA